MGTACFPQASHAMGVDAFELLVDAKVALHGKQRVAAQASQVREPFPALETLYRAPLFLAHLATPQTSGWPKLSHVGFLQKLIWMPPCSGGMRAAAACCWSFSKLSTAWSKGSAGGSDLPRGWGRFLGQESACIKRKSTR